MLCGTRRRSAVLQRCVQERVGVRVGIVSEGGLLGARSPCHEMLSSATRVRTPRAGRRVAFCSSRQLQSPARISRRFGTAPPACFFDTRPTSGEHGRHQIVCRYAAAAAAGPSGCRTASEIVVARSAIPRLEDRRIEHACTNTVGWRYERRRRAGKRNRRRPSAQAAAQHRSPLPAGSKLNWSCLPTRAPYRLLPRGC